MVENKAKSDFAPKSAHQPIRDWPATERPREKLLQFGPEGLSDGELLAVLLRIGKSGHSAEDMGRQLLTQFNGITGIDRAHIEELLAVPGMGIAKTAQLKADDKVTSIPMESVDEKDGYIYKPETRKFRQVKSGFTRFKNGDVIWAKITPCMQNGKSAIVSNLISCVGFGSTEFHVIRTKNASNLRSEYIHLLLRMPEIRNAATRYFVGSAGQQRVPKEFLENLHIPILPINVHEKLISMAKSAGRKIAEKRKKILARREKDMETIEEMILGIRPVEGI